MPVDDRHLVPFRTFLAQSAGRSTKSRVARVFLSKIQPIPTATNPKRKGTTDVSESEGTLQLQMMLLGGLARKANAVIKLSNATPKNLLAAEIDLEKAKHDHCECDDNDDVTVRFRHLAEHEAARFEVDDDETLQAIWDRAYVELEVDRDERDVLQAPKPGGNPANLMEHLALSLEEARRRELCDRTFEIAARTGGA